MRARRRDRPAMDRPAMAARMLAMTALVLAVCVVVALLIEIREPTASIPSIRPLPHNLLGP
jgi:hypothetical protein